MTLDANGVCHLPAIVADEDVVALQLLLTGRIPKGSAGVRLAPGAPLRPLIGSANRIAASLLAGARPVRALFFDKSPDRNWALSWHQDRTIAVRERVDTQGFTDWTCKSGLHHVVPPFEILERMLTVRIHLDPVGTDNAPLLVVPGSHRLGRIAEPDIAGIAERLGEAACEAGRGDIWVYATPILHASPRATAPTRRRVLQLLYSAEALPGGLEWLGV